MSQVGSSHKLRGIAVVAGGILVNITLGDTFGNISPYLTSYIRKRSKPTDLTYEMATWIFVANVSMLGSCMYFGGLFHRKIGARLTVSIASIIHSTGIILTYFSIKHSFYLVIVTYGILSGIGNALGYGAILACGMKWFPNNKSVVSGSLVAGVSVGILIFNQIQTAFINPNNLLPKGTRAHKYFDQEEILDRTPTCFLIMGACYIVLQLTGVMLMGDPKVDESVSIHPEPQHEGQYILSEENNKKKDISEDNLKPSLVIRERVFWIMWFTLLLSSVTKQLIFPLYKVFGQNVIFDDHYLALVGSLASVFDCLGRLFWGYLGDKFSFRCAMLGLSTCNVVFMLTLILTLETGKVMFTIWIFAIFFCMSGIFSLFPMATARSFGEEYAGEIYGLLYSSVAVSTILGTVYINILSKQVGWIGTFYFCAACSLGGGILAFIFDIGRSVRRVTREVPP
ncbi:apicoplast pyruvate carrier 1-like [Ptychodera flava]|uniref:apicoplast pyruvate carrier 1-like n=1 Tax=Ptychodera flava TaxID=63121 RepID=UPI00396A011C